jgi:mono/diheme cytochrome c family protein
MRAPRGLASLATLCFCFVAVSARAQSAAELYSKNCASCHGADLKGQTKVGQAMKVTDLTAPEVRAKFDRARMITSLTDGITRDGKQVKKPFKGKLTDEQIAALVDYVIAGGK